MATDMDASLKSTPKSGNLDISKGKYDEIKLDTDIAHAKLTRKVTEFLKELEPFVELLEQNRDDIDKIISEQRNSQ